MQSAARFSDEWLFLTVDDRQLSGSNFAIPIYSVRHSPDGLVFRKADKSDMDNLIESMFTLRYQF